jgi:two-component system, NtrC family, response regulator AlgB
MRSENRPSSAPPADLPLLESANPAMVRAIALARRVAASEVAVLLRGESGTGKHVLAAAIHDWSPRRTAAFIAVPCAALPQHRAADVLLAGVDDGWSKYDWLRAANGGTLFFDDVGDLPAVQQAKLMRFLDEHGFEVDGEGRLLEADALIVAATRRDLEADVRARRFREDPYFRLSTVQITLPPLRDRVEDLPGLTAHLLASLCARYRRGPLQLTGEVQQVFARYRWPGNVRELLSVIERAVALAQGTTITADDLPEYLLAAPTAPTSTPSLPTQALRDLERQHIERAIRESATLEDAALRLGIDPATLWRKRKRYGLT